MLRPIRFEFEPPQLREALGAAWQLSTHPVPGWTYPVVVAVRWAASDARKPEESRYVAGYVRREVRGWGSKVQ